MNYAIFFNYSVTFIRLKPANFVFPIQEKKSIKRSNQMKNYNYERQ